MLSYILRAVQRVPSSPANIITYTAEGGSITDSSTYTFTSVNIGTASSTREVFVLVNWSGSVISLASATIGGTSATITGQSTGTTSGNACIFCTLTSGTTANIVLTFNSTVSRVGFSVYSVTDRTSPTSTATDSIGIASFYNNGYTTTALTIPSNGFALGQTSFLNDVGSSVAITAFTKNNYNTVNASENNWYMSSSYNNPTGSETSPRISITWDVGTVGARDSSYAFP
jgi:hypothetical protein